MHWCVRARVHACMCECMGAGVCVGQNGHIDIDARARVRTHTTHNTQHTYLVHATAEAEVGVGSFVLFAVSTETVRVESVWLREHRGQTHGDGRRGDDDVAFRDGPLLSGSRLDL